MRNLFTTTGVLAALLIATPGSAANRCVNPAQPSCFATIQDAVNAALPGDRVTISPGVYFENVIVNTPDIRIEGNAKAILDPDDPNTGIGIQINAAATGVTIQGFWIRNGDVASIENDADGTTIRNMQITSTSEFASFPDCVSSDGNNLTVENNQFIGCGGHCLVFVGDDVLFSSNEAKFCGQGAVTGTGDRAIIENNRFFNVEDGDCIEIMGNDAEIVNNRAESCDGYFVQLTGHNAVVERNRGRLANGFGIDGLGFIVRSNRLEGIDVGFGQNPNGMRFTGTGGGDVSNNRLSRSFGDIEGMTFLGTLNGVRVENNRVERFTDDGINLGIMTSNFTVRRNRVMTIGGDVGEACYDVFGTNHALEQNRADDCGLGYEVGGAGHTFSRDESRRTTGSGFYLGGDGITLDRVTARDANAAGVEIDGNNHTVMNSRTLGTNGQEACDEGAGNVFTGNNFDPPDATCRDL